jgi:ABC-type transport system involved in Fe-S cluster assembly fused permease/ATPase subunit
VKIKVVPAHAWHQVILPVGLQLIVLATVAYDYFSPLPDATKIMMMLVLAVAAIQILLAWRATTRRSRNGRSESAPVEVATGVRTADEGGEGDQRDRAVARRAAPS